MPSLGKKKTTTTFIAFARLFHCLSTAFTILRHFAISLFYVLNNFVCLIGLKMTQRYVGHAGTDKSRQQSSGWMMSSPAGFRPICDNKVDRNMKPRGAFLTELCRADTELCPPAALGLVGTAIYFSLLPVPACRLL